MVSKTDKSHELKQSLTSRIATALRPKKSRNRLVKTAPESPVPIERKLDVSHPALAIQRNAAIHKTQGEPPPVQIYNNGSSAVDIQTGELWDESEMLHSLLRRDSHDSLQSLNKLERMRYQIPDSMRGRGENLIASLPAPLWEQISKHITPIDAANLALSSKTLLSLLGTESFLALNLTQNEAETHQHKINFLLGMDKHLPNHLLCFPCAIYHVRLQKGKERLKAKNVLNLIYNCPNPKLQSRHRLTIEYDLPFNFIQLAFRAQLYGPEYGISFESLSRRYKSRDSEWFHQTRYFFHRDHLLLRVVSKSFATGGLPPAGLRNFLYSREDYTPYFSVCSHWRDGELMNLCKCALSHMPLPTAGISQQLRSGPKVNISRLKSEQIFVTLCSNCRPMRRCPDCPTEYLIEIKLEEDRAETDPVRKFKQCMVVTRWSDLGDGKNPAAGEWAACNGEAEYDSFGNMGRRAIAGMFESQNGVTIPGQSILSVNPKMEKKGEAGHNWY